MFIPLNDTNALKHIRLQYVTIAIIALNCVIWLVMGTPAFFSQDTVLAANYSYGFVPAVVNGYQDLPTNLERIPETFTYVSYSFLHADFMHLAGNMLFIWVFGDNVEDAMGHLKFLFFYLACAAIGALGHSLIDPRSAAPLIGASGAAAGIIGAYILLHPRVKVWVLALGRIPLKVPAVFVLGAWIAFQFYSLIADSESQVSWVTHVFGILAGMVLVVFLRRPGVALFDRDLKVVVKTPETLKEVVGAIPPTSGTGAGITRSSGVKSGSVPSTGTKKKIRWGRDDNSQ
ncbi:MAG: rhomboid family intramembrane serine protease [Salaquimonas sp.]